MKILYKFQNHNQMLQRESLHDPNIVLCNYEDEDNMHIHYDYPEDNYITDNLVFHLDGIDCNSSTWVDKINGVTFNMYNITKDGQRVYFNGSSSYGSTSSVINYNYSSSTIEVVLYKTVRAGFVFDPVNANAIKYIQGGSYVNFTYGASGKRSAIQDQGLNKIFVHSINMDREIFNGTTYSFTSGDSWGGQGSGTFIGKRGNNSNYFKGYIYQIRIYNRKLSLKEIMHNQLIDKKRYNIT
jgi:hypothetical protein